MYQLPLILASYTLNEVLATSETLSTGSLGGVDATTIITFSID